MSEEIYSREESRSLKVGFGVAFALIILTSVIVMFRKKISSMNNGRFYNIEARFNRTDGLLVGDVVRIAGMNIGKVVDARLDDHFKAILTLEIEETVHIPDDSSASIVSNGLMGAKYIEIEPGGSEDNLQPGDEFAYTQDAMVLEELLDRIIGIGKANKKAGQKIPAENHAKEIVYE